MRGSFTLEHDASKGTATANRVLGFTSVFQGYTTGLARPLIWVESRAEASVFNQKHNTMIRYIPCLLILFLLLGCTHKIDEEHPKGEPDLGALERQIQLRLREYESYLRKGDSLALGNMYTEDAEIIPSTVGRENIIKVFGSMIRDSITGSSFKTTKLWGDDLLLVEDGTGTWSHTNGTVVSRGRYLLVWKKEDGKWKILRDTWFPDRN